MLKNEKMKNVKISVVLMAFMAALLVMSTGCTQEDEPEESKGGLDGNRLWGEITENVSFSEGETYLLDGAVFVKDGASLIIEEGVLIEANTSKVSYLLIEQGGTINAIGSATQPIVFTSNSENPAPGDWGGIMICGKSVINSVGGTGVSEIGSSPYGGDDDNDNSGTLSYIRVEYSGIAFDEEHEANGFAFYAVGRATQVDHLQSYKGADDGFEFFGGTLNAKYLVSTQSEDDSFDWTEGWRGKGQYWLANQGGASGDRGIEGDNNKNDNETTPYSQPVLSNVTLIGANFIDTYGMKLREGTKATIVNFIVTGFDKRSVHVEHNQTIANVNNDELNLDYARIDDQVTDMAIKYSVSTIIDVDDFDNDGDVTEEIDDPNAPLIDDAQRFENSGNFLIESVLATPSTVFAGGVDYSSVDSFFESDDNIGSGNSWTVGWTLGL